MSLPRVLQAALTWTGARFERDIQVEILPDGRIGGVGRLGRDDAERWPDRALLPGMVSAHSHAFQRALRGRGERFPGTAGSFWTWREAMYGLVPSLEATSLRTWCRRTFSEMRRAGITTVGEFHYLHHEGAGADYALDRVVLDAARDAGIRIVLLPAWYRWGGIGENLAASQERFATTDLDDFLRHLDALGSSLDSTREHLGVVAHSVRAAALVEIAELYAYARSNGLPFHMHLEEQRQEIAAAQAAWGKTPSAALLDRLPSVEGLTAVHCTHTAPADLRQLLDGGAGVCVCPLTEANLGDGLADVPALLYRPEAISLGTDSNARISMLEEMRLLEYGQRLSGERRGVTRDPEGQVARTLFQMASAGGARALGLDAGTIRTGARADFVLLDLHAPSLEGWDEETLLDAWVFGGGDETVAGTVVGGGEVTGR